MEIRDYSDSANDDKLTDSEKITHVNTIQKKRIKVE